MKELVRSHKEDNQKLGIYSVCSAHPLVIEAALKYELTSGKQVLIEATSNQVNQFGGYTGMHPKDFVNYVHDIAIKVGFPIERIILGGDHLGPNCWQQESASSAMAKSLELIKAYVEAGFTKIHLDASMSCADDEIPLDPMIVAKRSAEMCKVAEAHIAAELKSKLTYVIGTEVPVPGGEATEIETVHVSKLSDIRNTIDTHVTAFEALGISDALSRVIAVVVQPGVEFDHSKVIRFKKEKASEISRFIEGTPWLYEAHSTDYQTQEHLSDLVENHFAILKVGPALTFALREALFALAEMETEIVSIEQSSRFKKVVDDVLLDEPKYWKSYYGDKHSTIINNLHYSFSDRIRYYWSEPRIQNAFNLLIGNLRANPIPLSMLSQYMPKQYQKVSEGVIDLEPTTLVIDKIQEVVEMYSKACE
ncbi:tagatose-bisphosphate aldolase subunit GatZ [Vibrio mediterranei]|uniref:Tagatose-bisphosphate aldolase subunit GatZ n=1 Tax=Vibrio barjaei TaxID=1676683 RepID=A0ABW7IN49_9VIBR|nr:tagatose-bisphosphate aldolase subunit GatZ [Vibrio barjaei]MCG9789657.1 tagatose-bisphosphate aldolase subunit GatZ [Vibrio mediterranei]OIN26274.1 D-tagatose-bisphosphate aldolase, class II, non-catalytic subunit [Vibrio barjaei]